MSQTTRAIVVGRGAMTYLSVGGIRVGQPVRARAKHVELVRSGDVEFFVEVVDGGGPENVGLDRVLSFDGVRNTVEAVATQLSQVWDRVKPAEASVEFRLSLTTKAGRLTGLIVDADSSASLRVTLTWKSPAQPDDADD